MTSTIFGCVCACRRAAQFQLLVRSIELEFLVGRRMYYNQFSVYFNHGFQVIYLHKTQNGIRLYGTQLFSPASNSLLALKLLMFDVYCTISNPHINLPLCFEI